MRSLIEGLPDYERMMARSLALWENTLAEIRDELASKPRYLPETQRVLELCVALGPLKRVLPADPGPLKAPALFHELERELDHLHKRIVHAMPDRAYAHERCRILEQLLADLKAHALR